MNTDLMRADDDGMAILEFPKPKVKRPYRPQSANASLPVRLYSDWFGWELGVSEYGCRGFSSGPIEFWTWRNGTRAELYEVIDTEDGISLALAHENNQFRAENATLRQRLQDAEARAVSFADLRGTGKDEGIEIKLGDVITIWLDSTGDSSYSISNKGGYGYIRNLSDANIDSIVSALSQYDAKKDGE